MNFPLHLLLIAKRRSLAELLRIIIFPHFYKDETVWFNEIGLLITAVLRHTVTLDLCRPIDPEYVIASIDIFPHPKPHLVCALEFILVEVVGRVFIRIVYILFLQNLLVKHVELRR
jgi:hypothetical protein